MKLTAPKFWYRIGLINLILLPLCGIWWLGAWWRRRTTKAYKSPKNIIVIGGCLVGGSGKTPFVRHIRQYYHNSVVLVKSYNMKSPTKLVQASDIEIFDEALVHGMDGATIICETRVAGIKLAEQLQFDHIICDDGMQDATIIADKTYLVVDGHIGFGNGLLMPAGPNRMLPSSAISQCDEIIQINGAEGKFAKANKPYQYFQTRIIEKPDKQRDYLAFCGLAIPEKFYESALLAGFHIIDFISFPDHYRYGDADWQEITARAAQQQCHIITTQKDYVKIPAKYRPQIQALTIELYQHDQ